MRQMTSGQRGSATAIRRTVSHAMLATGAIILPASAVWAQVAPPPVPTREEILRAPDGEAQDVGAATIETDDDIERAPCPLANPEFANLRFTLRNVQFDNSGPIDLATLAPAWSATVGSEIPLSAICDIRDRAANILREAGYLAAVRVPVQTITDGVVHLDILAARLVGVQVRGDAGANEAQLARYLRQLEGQPLFNAHDAERYLLLASGIPGLDARLTLRPSGVPGEVIGEVTVARTPVVLDMNIQNYGSTSVGRIGGIARARFNGLTGMGDQTTFAVYSTADIDEQQVVQGGHELRIGSEGLTLATDLTYAWTRPTLPGNVPLKSDTLVWSSSLRYPLTLRQTRNMWVSGGFDWVDQDVRLAALPVTQDNLRILWTRFEANWIDPGAVNGRSAFGLSTPRWQIGVAAEARQGLASLGASDGCRSTPLLCFAPGVVPVSRVEGDPSAFVMRGKIEFVARPTRLWAVAVSARGQYAPRPLLSFEEFSAGNFTIGRGYDPGTLIGDSGVGYSAEFRFGRLIPRDRRSFAFQPYIFVDAAWVWNEDTSFAGLNPQRLGSAGVGVRALYGDTVQLDVTVAEPLERAGFATSRGPTRLLFSLTTQFGLGR